MVAFSFKAQFADLVASGKKTQTIRQTARAKPGDRLQLYTGMRTKKCRKLVDPDPVCTLVDYVGIRPDYLTQRRRPGRLWHDRYDEQWLYQSRWRRMGMLDLSAPRINPAGNSITKALPRLISD